MQKKIFQALIMAVILGLVLAAYARMQSNNYSITTSVLSGGGAPMGSANYDTNATVGQPSPLMDPANPPGATSYDLLPGFWYTLEAGLGLGCIWDLEPFPPDGDLDGLDLVEFATGFDLDDYNEDDLADFAVQFGRTDCF